MASFRIKGEIKGLDQFRATLEALDKKVRTQVLRSAMTAAGQVVLTAARGEVPVRTGLLKTSLAKRMKSYQSGSIWVAIVGPRTGFRRMLAQRFRRRLAAGRRLSARQGAVARALIRGQNPTKYAHLVELGVRPHALGKGSRLRKKVQAGRIHPGAPAHPFLRPALEGNTAAVTAALVQAIQDGVARSGKGTVKSA